MNVHIGWPQAIWVFLAVVSLILHGFLHGKNRQPTKYNAVAIAALIALEFGLLYWGGFFK